MHVYEDNRPHPLGLIDNPEWRATEARRADLYLEERARREPPHEPANAKWTLIIMAVVGVFIALVGSVL